MSDQDEGVEARVHHHARRQVPLYPMQGGADGGLLSLLTKAQDDEIEASVQAVSTGLKHLPFDIWQVLNFLNCNPHHARCLLAKAEAMVGLGFVSAEEMDENEQDIIPAARDALGVAAATPPPPPPTPASGSEPGSPPPASAVASPVTPPPMSNPKKRKPRSKTSKELDPLCQVSFQDVLSIVAKEFASTANGYIEVVREGDDPNGAIKGLYHMPSAHPRINIENFDYDFHYEVRSSGRTREAQEIGSRMYAQFGDLERVLADPKLKARRGNQPKVAELIHFRVPSSFSRWYGYPEWFSAVPSIEVAQALHQFQQDFFLNRGVPEFMLFAIGKKIGKKSWDLIDQALKAQIGLTNSHKSIAVNIECAPEELEIQIEKLAMEQGTDAKSFKDMSDTLSLEIVSAHGVPPLLAGIQIPGKLGATNELPNALMAFQVLCVGPMQNLLTSTLECTLGNKETNGGLGLGEGDFTFRTITDELDVDKMDTMSQMREPIMGAEGQARDLNEGLKKEDFVQLFKENPDVVSKALSTLIRELARGRAA